MGKHHIKRVTALFVIIWADISKATIIFTFSYAFLLANTKSVLSITPAGGKPIDKKNQVLDPSHELSV